VKKEDRRKLLEHMAALASDAESAPAEHVFFPVRAHGRALRPEVTVVEGVRGAGKTALFQAVQKLGPRLPRFYGDSGLPAADWVSAYSTDIEHPQPSALDDFANNNASSDEALRAWWLGHLVRRLKSQGEPAASGDFFTPVNVTAAAAELDRLEQSIPDKIVFASYDFLDQLGTLGTNLRRRWIRSLLSLWLPLTTRYRKLRPKIFLRHDLFEDAQSDFPDASKLRSRAQSLDWNVDDLFGLVVRHLANAGPSVDLARHWLTEEAGLELREDVEFGWLTEPLDEEHRKSFARALAGDVMGTGTRKGFVYRWIPNHLQDAGGRIVPRSILRLLGHAAVLALQSNISKGPTLLSPTDLQNALALASRQRANELREEHPIVLRLENLRDKVLLLDPEEAKRELARASPQEPKSMAEVRNGAAVLDELKRIGVVSVRDDGRIDVPDIYREGFGIKRKGGTKRT
jgi:hypothetical protein